ncbi:ComF family protein [Vibrio genomosp. F10 str. 9ZC157]|uniref:Amidophosphoribosyltransferase n=1 Tax=Vibrio genomosp. F10 str. ZF-129 TaxID=1187848 RepID=A0A1E5BDF4_9VIBR|nr:ComF family protein [Vibrio genomosp. F10]OEE33064.1 amidophosphoribosyltransferase [Vibrio genomosp. F10 str. ZF-129]OEE98203.1 amidophosphoribosyltransferase [Vibrio genomosp. F10 str. 9ZC157]
MFYQNLALMLSDWLQKTMRMHLGCYCDLCQLPIHTPLPLKTSDREHAKRKETTRQRIGRNDIEWESIWCDSCKEHFAPTTRCSRCGLTTLTQTDQCGQCLAHPPLWSKLYCVGDYKLPLSSYVHRFKYQQQFWHAKPLAALLSERIDATPDLIASVPLHWQRQLMRGFNQSDLLAKQLGKRLDIEIEPNLFSRVKSTPQQKGLNKKQRQQNLRNAFRLNASPQQKHIAIFDDVVTTGSTIHHLCQLLLDAGVETIDIYCICRTPETDNSI